MTHRPITLYPNEILSRRAEPREVDDALREAGADLLSTAEHHRAYGLAAAHIGLVEPVVVVSMGSIEARDYRVMFNPVVIAASTETAVGAEGSVSLPGIEVDVLRPYAVEVEYDDEAGVRSVVSLEGFPSRVAQHEIDQVNGVFFLERVSRLKRDAALRRFRKLNR
ncbi:MAG: peptide deformylase [Phyllobacteriaceae bacterium]|nr:peptide deformylase [Phyllobacteriaceae bacterium]